MLNQVVLVGRLVKKPEIIVTSEGKEVSNIVLAVPRSFKNSKGEYDTDFIRCVLWENIARNAKEYCEKGNVLGIKGRIQSKVLEKEDKNETIIEVIAEKLSFLSSKKDEEKVKKNNKEK